MNRIQIVVVVFAVLAIIEAVWILAAPTGFKGFARAFLRGAEKLTTLLPIVLAAVGLAVWVLVLFDRPMYVMLAILIGGFFWLAAFLYSRADLLARWTKRLVLDRSPVFLRGLAVVMLVVAALFLWTAIAGK